MQILIREIDIDMTWRKHNEKSGYENLLRGVLLITGRNKFGNVVYVNSPFEIKENILRNLEKDVLEHFNKRITAFWKKAPLEKSGDKIQIELELDFDAKYPYTEHPLPFIKMKNII